MNGQRRQWANVPVSKQYLTITFQSIKLTNNNHPNAVHNNNPPSLTSAIYLQTNFSSNLPNCFAFLGSHLWNSFSCEIMSRALLLMMKTSSTVLPSSTLNHLIEKWSKMNQIGSPLTKKRYS